MRVRTLRLGVLLLLATAACAGRVLRPDDCPEAADLRCTTERSWHEDVQRQCMTCHCERRWWQRPGDESSTVGEAEAAGTPSEGDGEAAAESGAEAGEATEADESASPDGGE